MLKRLRLIITNLYWSLIQPKTKHPDSERREFILNILLAGLVLTALAALIVSVVNYFKGHLVNGDQSLIIMALFLLILIGLWKLSRLGFHQQLSYVLIICTGLIATYLVVEWSFELPMAEMAYALMLVIAGVLLSAQVALLFTGLAVFLLLLLSYAQAYGYFHPHTSWLDQPLLISDAVGYCTIFAIIGLVSWLANREIDRSLTRARTSESALQQERDSLEVKVIERTSQLEQSQLERMVELQRFAEFGRLSANLLHEVANPLTAASLNLQQVPGQQSSQLVQQARKNLHHLERYLDAARKQLKGQSQQSSFSIRQELSQIMSVLTPTAKKDGVKLSARYDGVYRLFGDPVKFNQLMANLIVNAIEAYRNSALIPEERRVEIRVTRDRAHVVITVSDWGQGITPRQRQHLFEPFYSTKLASKRGMGIGLAMVKQFVEEEFGGRISVSSSPVKGTRFMLRLASPSRKTAS